MYDYNKTGKKKKKETDLTWKSQNWLFFVTDRLPMQKKLKAELNHKILIKIKDFGY